MVSVVDVAKAAGLSAGTVSQILNCQDARYSPRTRQRVQEVARSLGYQPNRMAQKLVTQTSRTIGVLFQDLTYSSANEMLLGMLPVFKKAGYDHEISVSFWDLDLERRDVEAARQLRLDGLIAVPLPGPGAAYADAIANGMPVVFVSDHLAAIPADSVCVDGADAAYRVTQHLLERGHHRIAYLGVKSESLQLLDRHRGFRRAMAEANLPVPKEYELWGKVNDIPSIEKRVQQFLKLPVPPTAIVAVSDPVATQGLGMLHRQGATGQIALAGIGDVPMSDHACISLTTVSEPVREMGRRAAERILERLNHPELAPAPIRLRGKLVVRDSTPAASSPKTKPPKRRPCMT